MFGGCDSDTQPAGPNNQLYKLSMQGEFSWKKIDADSGAKGTAPAPRWMHSATVFGKTKILFFGGFHSNTNRFNDTHVFDTATSTWSQPVAAQSSFTPRGMHTTSKTAMAGCPSPRGAHAACLVDNILYVMGGYGGVGYSRRDFNDLYALNLEDFQWTKVATKNKSPTTRSGHSAVAVMKGGEKFIYVFGGWNADKQFSDLWILDIETFSWNLTDAKLGSARWNHACVSVEAIPHWKMFIFGGATGDLSDGKTRADYLNDVAVLDTGANFWQTPEVNGDPPSARSDSELAYDAKGSRLILFGGWANKWHGDIYTLDVGCVVGPPYAIMGIEPKIGPITGCATVQIMGIDFIDTPQVVVRFSTRKGAVDVTGTYKSDELIECETPDFSNFGPGEVDVRVSLRGDSFTTTYQKYSFFAVTDASKSVAFGPGLLEGAAAGTECKFVVVSRDTSGQDRTSGGDQFQIQLKNKDNGMMPTADVQDNDDGTYTVSFTPDAGTYEINVVFEGTFNGVAGHVVGSPFKAKFEDGADPKNNTMSGPLLKSKIDDDLKRLVKFTKDTDTSLSTHVPDDNLNALLKVKGTLLNVAEITPEIELASSLHGAAVSWMATQGQNVSSMQKLLQNLARGWENVLELVPAKKTEIAPLVKRFGEKTANDVAAYEETLKQYKQEFKDKSFFKFETHYDPALAALEDADKSFKKEMETCESMRNLAKIFEFPEAMKGCDEIMNEIENTMGYMSKLWETIDKLLNYIDTSRTTLWKDVQADEMEEEAKKFLKQVKGCHKSIKWCNAYTQIEQECKDFLFTCPLISALGHKAMRKRHWEMLMTATGTQFTIPKEDPTLKLAGLLALGLHKFGEQVEEITDQAQKEEKMEETLKTLEITWAAIDFVGEPYKEGSNVTLLRIGEEEFETLEADQLTVQGMMGSRFLATFESEVTGWSQKLGNVSEVIILLSEIQRLWSYLEPLFIGSDEVKRELPEDAKRFADLDVKVKEILSQAWKTKNVADACNAPGLYDALEVQSNNLDMCKKSLADFLDGKRRQFPRFYFLSEAQLLDILSNGSNPHKILKHVNAVFLATKTYELEDQAGGRPKAVKWVSAVGKETSPFTPPVPLEGKPEIYLQTVLDAKKSSLHINAETSLAEYAKQDRPTWLLRRADDGEAPADAAQISLLVSGMSYTSETEEAFKDISAGKKDALADHYTKILSQLGDLIKVTRTNLSKADRTRVMCMITMDSHSRDSVNRMVRDAVAEASHFLWQSQVKWVWEEVTSGPQTGTIAPVIHICDAKFNYGYEYLGNGGRLVITPLTDRIYVTATQALNLILGCAPAGPAGTGKTESTKDLAAHLGLACYVTNCAPEMDYRTMGNIFKGLAASGVWGCFDEFNRLISPVLSVCTVQYKAVLDAIRADKSRVVIEGDEVNCDHKVGAYITMNPGYLGRSTLPEGLKALFRPMTVMVPDLTMICENMMMAEGFEEAKSLARKFFGLYSLLGELLSKQKHYDWGLRAVKSVLVVAGSMKRQDSKESEETGREPLTESDILLRALRDFNIPKIVTQDEVVFFGLLGDLFPGLNPPRERDETLESAVVQACENRGMEPEDDFCLKCVQLEELLAIRHCVFVMGPPGSGRTECWKTLAESCIIRGNKVKIRDLNPKAITPEELYGFINLATREWKDGVLSKVLRDQGQEPDVDNSKWLMLDGDLDANWIESMNSVMDDNKTLTLASNERVPVKPNMRLLFEIRDLDYATPATTSRAGILYISSNKGMQWRNLISAWGRSMQDSDKREFAISGAAHECLVELFAEYVPTILSYMKKFIVALIPIMEITMVQSLLWMLEGLLTAKNTEGATAADCKSLIEPAFVFAAIWAFGSVLAERDGVDYRSQFNEYWRGEWKSVKIPSRDTIFDYYLNPEENKFEPWKNSPFFYSIDYSSTTPMSQVTVPTPETASTSHWMEMLVAQGNPIMLVGNAGCGKTALVNGLLSQQDPTVRMSATVAFNFYTNANLLQTTMEGPLEKKTGTTFAPPGTARIIYFLDDLNLPEVDVYNTQSAISLARQHMDYGGWWDLSKLQCKKIQKAQYIACMNQSAGSYTVNPRLQRHFATFAIGFPGPTSLLTIYQTFLDGHLKNFSEDIQALSTNIINGALGMQSEVTKSFRKTAINFHYEFNVRHLANVFQGILQSKPDEYNGNPEKFVLLWLHESTRVYGDRLVSYEDLHKFNSIAVAQSKKRFSSYNVSNYFASQNADQLVFFHFCESFDEQAYDRVTSMTDLKTLIEAGLKEYNDMYPAMNLVLFQDALKHVCRISRAILNPSGHALLVGVGGSGKQSLSRLSAHVCQYTVKQIVITSSYSINDLKTDLIEMFMKAGVKEQGIMFLFTDQQIFNERCLVFMNDLLSSGQIPDLFPLEEIDNIINGVTSRVKSSGKTPDRKNCWEFFINEVKRNLHVVLCFSPVGDGFRNRSLKFPALVNCTVIDWFQPWPYEALLSVGQTFMKDVTFPDPETRDAVERFMPYCFEAVNKETKIFKQIEQRYVYTTPKSYLENLKLFISMLDEKRTESSASIERLSNGLQKLLETAESVAILEANLKVELVAAEEKKVTAEGIASVVGKEKEVVDAATAAANEEAAKTAIIQKEVSAIAADAQADLDNAEPLVKKAMAALDTLNKKDLANCKTMKKPPPGVDDVFSAVMCLLAGLMDNIPIKKNGAPKDTSWPSVKKTMLGDIGGFLDTLLNYKQTVDEFRVPKMNWKQVRPFLELEHFDYEIINGKNSAAGGLCNWCINIVTYYDTITGVEPKRQALAAAQTKLDAANKKMEEVTAQVNELTSKLAILTKDLDEANATKQEAIDKVEAGQKKVGLATRLINALSSNKVIWAETIETLKANEGKIVGDVVIASSFISYVGPFTKKFRDKLIFEEMAPFLKKNGPKDEEGNVLGVPCDPSCDPVKVLATDADMASWQSHTLPSDRVSCENGAIVVNTARWPLMIDPQLQGIRWIMSSQKDNNLQVVRLGQKQMLPKLEAALEHGHSLLIENMGESVDAVLNPVIARQLIQRGSKKLVKIGDKEIEFHPNFKLFMHTKLSNPHYPPEVQAEAALVNFTVTEAGLSDQLLSLVVKKERADLAQTRARLIREDQEFKIKIKELEDNILYKLATAEGDITEDVELIEGLEDSKRVSEEIAEKMVIAATTQATIAETSAKYRSVADRGSLLFFLMNELFKVHAYYMYSLNAFVVIFLRGIDLVSAKKAKAGGSSMLSRFKKAAKKVIVSMRFSWNSDVLAEASNCDQISMQELLDAKKKEQMTPEEIQERCGVLMGSITEVVFNYTRRGLFDKDKLMVATMLTLQVLNRAGELSDLEVATLVGGLQHSDPGNMGPLSEWMPESLWPKLKQLENIGEAFENIGDNMQTDDEEWMNWYNNARPDQIKFPGDYNNLSDFHKLLILNCLRKDRVTTAMTKYISQKLGSVFVNQAPFNMKSTFDETSPSTPILFVLFPGVDPTAWVEELGAQKNMTAERGKFLNISMGQGQEEPAKKALNKFAAEGGWIFLQNVHLMKDWLPTLERQLEICSAEAHQDFRCFISAEPPPMATGFYSKVIPESLLQSCIKVSNQAPADLKSNLRRSWDTFSKERIAECEKPTQYKACLFTLCWFHSIILGRMKYGQMGWSRKYSFNTGDLIICSNILSSYINASDDTPWADLNYLFAEIMYGGHITDPWDRRTNSTYLKVMLKPELFQLCDLVPSREGLMVMEENDDGDEIMVPSPALFPNPDPNKLEYADYATYIEEKLPEEVPDLFGLHANAEIGYLTNWANDIFNTILIIQGGAGGDDGGSGGGGGVVSVINDLLERLPDNFNMAVVEETAEPLSELKTFPYVIVAIQECQRMNKLMSEIRNTLTELDKGLKGELNMSDNMESLGEALVINQVPGRDPLAKASWEKFAWWSSKNLVSWFADVLVRIEQLVKWSETLILPTTMWYPGLFNPKAFNTAVMQVTSRNTGMALDNMDCETYFTTFLKPQEADDAGSPENGAFIYGWYMEGARWLSERDKDEEEEPGEITDITGTATQGFLVDSRLKQLLQPLPVVYLKAVEVQDTWDPTSVGYMRRDPRIYEAPVYSTTFRGPTYIFLATCKVHEKDKASKWILAAVAIILQTDD
jgi:dynein heavy chain